MSLSFQNHWKSVVYWRHRAKCLHNIDIVNYHLYSSQIHTSINEYNEETYYLEYQNSIFNMGHVEYGFEEDFISVILDTENINKSSHYLNLIKNAIHTQDISMFEYIWKLCLPIIKLDLSRFTYISTEIMKVAGLYIHTNLKFYDVVHDRTFEIIDNDTNNIYDNTNKLIG